MTSPPASPNKRPGEFWVSRKDRLGALLLGLILLGYLVASLPGGTSRALLVSSDSLERARSSKNAKPLNDRVFLPRKRSKKAVSKESYFPSTHAQNNGEQNRQKQAFRPAMRQARYTHEPISLNNADSASFERLPGIGPVLASRIIRYREKLGGFYQTSQLREVYGISDSLYTLLEPLLKEISGNAQTRKIDINRISFDTLRQHPYLRWDKAKAIIRYREANGPFRSEKDLRNIWTLDSSTLARLLPYIQFDSLTQ